MLGLGDRRVPGLPDRRRDADPRQVARQARVRAAHGARRRGPDLLPPRVRAGADRGSSRSTCSSGRRRSSPRWSARGASGSATTPPARTSSASGSSSGSRRRPRCRRTLAALGRGRRPGLAADRAGDRRPPVPRPAAQIDPASRAAIGGRLADRRERVRRARRRRPAPRRRPSSPRSSPPAASATRPGSPARPSCGGG